MVVGHLFLKRFLECLDIDSRIDESQLFPAALESALTAL